MGKKKEWTGERLETGIFNETTIEHLHRYALALAYARGKTVLDIACGDGYGTRLLAHEAASVTGIDKDAATIQQAQEKYRQPNLEFLTGDAENIPLTGNRFDLVVCFETIEHTSGQEKMMTELKRMLKPGGLLIISTPDKAYFSGRQAAPNPFHVKELTEKELSTLLNKYFTHVSLLHQQMNFSSLITGHNTTSFKMYTGGFDSIEEITSPAAMYIIGMASDGPLEPVQASLFTGQSLFEKAVEEKERLIKKSITYQAGHFILLPFKWAGRLFSSRR